MSTSDLVSTEEDGKIGELPHQKKKKPKKKIDIDFSQNQICSFCSDLISDKTHIV